MRDNINAIVNGIVFSGKEADAASECPSVYVPWDKHEALPNVTFLDFTDKTLFTFLKNAINDNLRADTLNSIIASQLLDGDDDMSIDGELFKVDLPFNVNEAVPHLHQDERLFCERPQPR